MAPKAATVRSVVRRFHPTRETLSEPGIVSASPTPSFAITRSEATLPSATVGRVRSRGERVEKGGEMGDISKLAKQRMDAFDRHRTPVLQSAYPQSPAMLPLVGPHILPGSPLHPIVSQRDPLGLFDKPRIPSPKTTNIIGQRWKAKEYRLATKEVVHAGLLPGAKSVNSATEIDSFGRPLPKLWEWYYPEPHRLGRQIGWNPGPWEE